MKRLLILALLIPLTLEAAAGPLLDRLRERRAAAQQQGGEDDDGYGEQGKARLPAGVTLSRDLPYGPGKDQRFDVYAPDKRSATPAPVVFMVHGGGWRRGDKAMQSVVENKVARWVTRGFIVVSANYRMLPGADVAQQAADVAKALAVAGQQAPGWGGDPNKFIMMGHSAGAHLVALIASSPAIAGSARWLGTVALDSAAMDVETVMQGKHYRLHDQAFGKDPAFWRQVSPYAALQGPGRPMLAVCSTRREEACAQAERYVGKASSLGTRASVLREDLSHKDINQTLGQESAYTRAVEDFMRSLLPGETRL